MNRWLGCETLGQSIIILLDWRSSFWEPAPTWNGHVFPRNPVVENWVSLHCCNPLSACSFTCISTPAPRAGALAELCNVNVTSLLRQPEDARGAYVTALLNQSKRAYTESHMASDGSMWEKGPATLSQPIDSEIIHSLALLTHFNPVCIKADYSKKDRTLMSRL